MFLRTKKPMPVGTVINFKVELADGQRVMQGTAKVQWVREAPTSPKEPAGMGVEFINLDDASQKLVERMLRLTAQVAPRTPEPSHRPPPAPGELEDEPLTLPQVPPVPAPIAPNPER